MLIAFDSGIERTGYAVFNLHESRYTVQAYGCIITPKVSTLPVRIATLHDKVEELISQYRPDVFIIERLFFTMNKKTAITVAQAQGAVLRLAGHHGIEVEFLTPNQIKQAITGYGNADKKSVQQMVALMLELEEAPKYDDTTDALACGLTYCTMKALHDRQAQGANS